MEDAFLGMETGTSAYYGRLTDARGFSERAVASTERAELKETRAKHEAALTLIEALMGNGREAQEWADFPLGHSPGRDVQYGAGLALAMTNNSIRVFVIGDLAVLLCRVTGGPKSPLLGEAGRVSNRLR